MGPTRDSDPTGANYHLSHVWYIPRDGLSIPISMQVTALHEQCPSPLNAHMFDV